MRDSVTLRELNQHTSAVIHRVVDDQEELVITRGGQPVARIVPITEHETLLSQWAAEGRVSMPTRSGPLPMPVKTPGFIDVAQQLINDRENERW